MMQTSENVVTLGLPATVRPKRIRIAIVERHALVADAVDALIRIEPDCEIVGSYRSADEVLRDIRTLRPDVLLTDLAPPGHTGNDWLARFKELSPATRALVLTEHAEIPCVCAAIDAGADGYVLKTSSSGELIQAIRALSAGRAFLCNALSIEAVDAYRASGGHTPLSRPPIAITKREREVLTCIVSGYSNKLTARHLGVSPKTIAKHRSNLMRKLQRRNLSELAMFAFHNGMVGA